MTVKINLDKLFHFRFINLFMFVQNIHCYLQNTAYKIDKFKDSSLL